MSEDPYNPERYHALRYWRDPVVVPRMSDSIDPDRIADDFIELAEFLPTLCWIARGDGYIIWYNHRWYEYCGTTPEQMEGWGWQAVHDPDQLPAVMDRWQANFSSAPLRAVVAAARISVAASFAVKVMTN